MGESWHIIGAAGEPPFQSGYAAEGAPYEPPAYRSMEGSVQLRGAAIQNAADPTYLDGGPIFTLPAEQRPDGLQVLGANYYNALTGILDPVALLVDVAGAIAVPPAAALPGVILSLDGVEIALAEPAAPSIARPTVAEVAAEIRARTKGGELGGTELGNFDTTTRPTAAQAEATIDNAYEDLLACFPSGQIPERQRQAFKAACRLRAALKIEISYFPEQTGEANSPYLQLRRDAEAAEEKLLSGAALRLDETNPGTANEPLVGI